MATNQRLNAKITIGGAVSRTLIGGLSRTERQLGQVGDALQTLKKRQAGLERYRDNWRDMGRDVSHVNDRLERTNRLVGKLQTSQKRIGRIRGAQEANTEKRDRLQGQVGGLLAMGASIAAPVTAAVRFQTTMAEINKVGQLTEKQYSATRQSILKMTRSMPMATDQIGAIMTSAMKSGVAQKNLEGFTRTAIRMGTAFDMSGGNAGDLLMQWRAGMKLSQEEVVELADVTNHLANNAKNVTAPALSQVIGRVGSLASQAGIGKNSLAGLSAAMLSSGKAPERVGTAMRKLTTVLAKGESATNREKAAFERLGMTASDVSKSMQKDAEGTIQRIFDKLGEVSDSERLSVVNNLFGQESLDVITPLVTNTELLSESLRMAGDSAAYSNSMLAEYEEMKGTTANQFELLKNRTEALGIQIGEVLRPSVQAVAGGIGSLMTGASNLVQTFPLATKVVIGTAAALAGAKIAAVGGGWAFTFLKGGALSLVGGLYKAQAAALVMASANYGLASSGGAAALSIKGIGAALMANPIGIAIGAITAGALLIYKYWEPVSAFFAGVGRGIAEAFGPVTPVFSAIGSAIGSVVGWFGALLAPVDMAAEKLDKVGNVGETIGKILGTLFKWSPIGLLLKSWGPVLEWFKDLGDVIGNLADWLGFDGDGEPPRSQVGGANAQRPGADPGAGVARARDGSRIESQDNSVNVTVSQQPGEDGEQLARRVSEEVSKQQRGRGRGALYDRGPDYGY